MLLFSLNVGKSKVNKLHIVVLDHLQDIFNLGHDKALLISKHVDFNGNPSHLKGL